MPHKPFALSLSGGGLSSLAYAGFVEILLKHNIVPAYYAGLSGGAMLGVLLASGLSSPQIVDMLKQVETLKVLNFHLRKLEIIDHNSIKKLLHSLLPYKRFEELPTPALIFATDLVQKKPLAIDSGDIASAVVASCGLFPVLQPVKRMGHLLGDGGFTVYYGAQYIHERGIKTVIGVDVIGLCEGTVPGILGALYKQINSSVTSNARYELSEFPVDLDIKINFPAPSIFTINKQTERILDLGRHIAQNHLSEIQKLIN